MGLHITAEQEAACSAQFGHCFCVDVPKKKRLNLKHLAYAPQSLSRMSALPPAIMRHSTHLKEVKQ